MDNSLKRSFPLRLKEEKEKGCGCNDQAEELREAFSQDEGVTSFLKEQKNPFTEEEGEEEEEEEMPPEMEDEEEMEEADRGAVEDVLGELNDDYEPSGRQQEDTSRGAVEDVLRSLNSGDTDGYGLNQEGDVPEELEDNQFEAEDEEDEEEMDEVVASVLDELNGDSEQQGLREDWQLNEDDPCWKNYTMVGMKTDENGNEVPNCVPDDEAENYDPDESASLSEDELLNTVLEDQVNELTRLDQLAEQVLNG
jgi:hypothetical protein